MNVAILKPRFMRPTARILAKLLEQKGHHIHDSVRPDTDAIVNYGRGGTLQRDDCPALNRSGRCDKRTELGLLHRHGILAPDTYTSPPDENSGAYPLVGRRLEHRGGRDITVHYTPHTARLAYQQDRADYFTGLLDVKREWRTWIYRRHHLATYEKVLTRPEQNTHFGRNYANGYSFSLRQMGEFPIAVGIWAARAVDAVMLDFGGADIVETTDGRIVVLEVNSAPGILSDRRRAVAHLARRVNAWLLNGCTPRREWRRGDEDDVYRWDREQGEVQGAE